MHILPFQSLARIHVLLQYKSIIQADFPNGQFRIEQSIRAPTEGHYVVLVELFIGELKHGAEIASYRKPELSKEAGKRNNKEQG